MSLGSSMAPDADQRATANYRPVSPVCLSSFWQNGRAQRGNRRIGEPQATCHPLPSAQPSSSAYIQVAGFTNLAWPPCRFRYFPHRLYVRQRARRSRVLGKISRRLRHPSYDKMLRVSRQNGRPSGVWVVTTKPRTQRGIFPCQIHVLSYVKASLSRSGTLNMIMTTAQLKNRQTNLSTNDKLRKHRRHTHLSSSLLLPPLSDATHTNTAAAHLISMPARQSRSSLPFGQLADIVQDTRRAKDRVSLGTQTPFCRPACFLPSPPACGCRGPHENAYHGSLSGTVGSPRLSPAGSALLSALLASVK